MLHLRSLRLPRHCHYGHHCSQTSIRDQQVLLATTTAPRPRRPRSPAANGRSHLAPHALAQRRAGLVDLAQLCFWSTCIGAGIPHDYHPGLRASRKSAWPVRWPGVGRASGHPACIPPRAGHSQRPRTQSWIIRHLPPVFSLCLSSPSSTSLPSRIPPLIRPPPPPVSFQSRRAH